MSCGYDISNFAERMRNIISRGVSRYNIDMNDVTDEPPIWVLRPKVHRIKHHDRRPNLSASQVAESIFDRIAVLDAEIKSIRTAQLSNGGASYYIYVFGHKSDGTKFQTSYSIHSSDIVVAKIVLKLLVEKIKASRHGVHA